MIDGSLQKTARSVVGQKYVATSDHPYAFQFSVLLPKFRRKTRSITSWCAWVPSRPIHRACPLCLNDQTNQAILLAWKLPLMLSCPQHGCWLGFYWGVPGRLLGW
ncbi:TniQ family protein, partial [Pseudomonas aeruginosa]|uniref:TniQ family protein n=1 Tax=Pseudomonas aeruginosa TaxID=287 RepID=UPI003EC0072E